MNGWHSNESNECPTWIFQNIQFWNAFVVPFHPRNYYSHCTNWCTCMMYNVYTISVAWISLEWTYEFQILAYAFKFKHHSFIEAIRKIRCQISLINRICTELSIMNIIFNTYFMIKQALNGFIIFAETST